MDYRLLGMVMLIGKGGSEGNVLSRPMMDTQGGGGGCDWNDDLV